MSTQDKLYEYIGKQAQNNYIYTEAIIKLSKKFNLSNYEVLDLIRSIKTPKLEKFIEAEKNKIKENYL